MSETTGVARLDATGAEIPPWVTDLQLLDAEIARRVFGHHIPERVTDWANRLAVPPYSSRIEHAWTVVERCTAIGPFGYRDVNGLPVATWFMAHFEKAGLWSCSSREAAEKICRIALAAIEGRRVDAP